MSSMKRNMNQLSTNLKTIEKVHLRNVGDGPSKGVAKIRKARKVAKTNASKKAKSALQKKAKKIVSPNVDETIVEENTGMKNSVKATEPVEEQSPLNDLSDVAEIPYPNSSEELYLQATEDEAENISLSENEYDVEAILDFENYSEDDGEEESFKGEIPTLKPVTASKQKDFFKAFGKLPVIGNISLSASEISLAHISTESESEADALKEATLEVDESTCGDGEYSDFDFNYETSEEVEFTIVAHSTADDNDLFEKYIEKTQENTIIRFDESNFINYERVQDLIKGTKNFLRSLIDAAVQLAEPVDPQEAMRKNLNKVELFRKLAGLLEEKQIEWKISNFLQKKCIVHYRQQKSYRQITPEIQEAYMVTKEKYEKVLEDLDCLLGRENTASLLIKERIQEAEGAEQEAEEKLEDLTTDLEAIIRQTFEGRSSSKAFKNLVESSIKNMSALREKISTVRQELIKRQHAGRALVENVQKQQQISETFTLTDYLLTRDQNLLLEEKIEEKTARLEKMHNSLNRMTNMIAHLRERQSMIYTAAQTQLKQLVEAQSEKRRIRLNNHKLSLNSLAAQKELQVKSLDYDLLCMPALLNDYDSTVELITKMKADIEEKKFRILKLRRKISLLDEGKGSKKDIIQI